jgi:hypothetical protein
MAKKAKIISFIKLTLKWIAYPNQPQQLWTPTNHPTALNPISRHPTTISGPIPDTQQPLETQSLKHNQKSAASRRFTDSQQSSNYLQKM